MANVQVSGSGNDSSGELENGVQVDSRGIFTLRDELSGLSRPPQDNVNGFGTMSYGGYRDGGAQAPPCFNNRGESDMNLAWESLMVMDWIQMMAVGFILGQICA